MSDELKALVERCLANLAEIQSAALSAGRANIYTPQIVQHAQDTVANLHQISALLSRASGGEGAVAYLAPNGLLYAADERDEAERYCSLYDNAQLVPLYTHPAPALRQQTVTDNLGRTAIKLATDKTIPIEHLRWLSGAHYINIEVRHNGRTDYIEADWLKPDARAALTAALNTEGKGE